MNAPVNSCFLKFSSRALRAGGLSCSNSLPSAAGFHEGQRPKSLAASAPVLTGFWLKATWHAWCRFRLIQGNHLMSLAKQYAFTHAWKPWATPLPSWPLCLDSRHPTTGLQFSGFRCVFSKGLRLKRGFHNHPQRLELDLPICQHCCGTSWAANLGRNFAFQGARSSKIPSHGPQRATSFEPLFAGEGSWNICRIIKGAPEPLEPSD